MRLALAINDRKQVLDYLRRYTVVVGDDPEGLLQAAEYDLAWSFLIEADLAGRAKNKEIPVGLIGFWDWRSGGEATWRWRRKTWGGRTGTPP